MDYRPMPVDTSRVVLPPDLAECIELLARNTHEVWAALRMAQGWRHGENRDDAGKLHPDLVPYEELPESEKEYDRRAAAELLRVILALGFKLDPPGT